MAKDNEKVPYWARFMRYDASLRDLLFPELIPPLFRSGQDYSDDMIAVEAARLSYFRFEEDEHSRNSIEWALRTVGFGQVEYFSGTVEKPHAMAAVQTSGNKALIVFRGTRPTKFQDIRDDLELLPVPWPVGGNVHEGFKKQFEELADPLRRWRDRAAAERELFIAGHSLGAGLATLCATLLKPSTLVTIGSSRVGDSEFVRLFDGAVVHRYVGCCDIITRLPGEGLGYRHVGESLYIAQNGAVYENPTDDFIKKDCTRAQFTYLVKYAWRWGNVWFRYAADHSPINYITAILGQRDT